MIVTPTFDRAGFGQVVRSPSCRSYSARRLALTQSDVIGSVRVPKKQCWPSAEVLEQGLLGWVSSGVLHIHLFTTLNRRLLSIVMDASVQVHPALLQVMQHPAICNDQQSIATLLCTSKQFTRAVKDRCSGLIQLVCRFDSLQQAQGLAKWLAANGSLARSLEIGPSNPSIQIGSRRDQATAAIAQALGRAGSSQQGLKLQHMVLNEVSNDPALLQQLTHSSQLTALTVLLPRVKDTTTSAGSTALLVPALRGEMGSFSYCSSL